MSPCTLKDNQIWNAWIFIKETLLSFQVLSFYVSITSSPSKCAGCRPSQDFSDFIFGLTYGGESAPQKRQKYRIIQLPEGNKLKGFWLVHSDGVSFVTVQRKILIRDLWHQRPHLHIVLRDQINEAELVI